MNTHTNNIDHETGSVAPGTGAVARQLFKNNIPPGAPLFNRPQNHLPLSGAPLSSNIFDTPISPEAEVENPQGNFKEAPSMKVVVDFESTENRASQNAAQILDVAIDPPKSFKINKVEYDARFGPEMYEYFSTREKYKITYDTYTWKNGEITEKERKVANTPPHFSEFARSIGVTARRLKMWAKKYEEFSEYYDACIDVIQEFYIDNGVTGKYSGQFSIFAAKNTTKMKDVQETLNKTVNFKDVLDAIEKGKNLEDGNF